MTSTGLNSTIRRHARDPRYAQIAALGGLLLYGRAALAFPVTAAGIGIVVATALAVQWAACRWVRVPFDWRSPTISAMSMTLLGRGSHELWIGVAVAVAIASKFLIRWRGKHIFNPTNFGLVAVAALTPHLWISPGQWGSGAFFGFLLVCIGLTVVLRAARTDVTVTFLAAYASIVFVRALWLGDPPAIPVHHLQNGALLIFAFFMISDPKTTPDARPGRVVFAILVALGGAFVHFYLYQPNGFLWALVAGCLLVPLLDRIFPNASYRWPLVRSRHEPPLPWQRKELA